MESFYKKGLKFKKKGSLLTVGFKEPLQVNYDAPVEEILSQIMDAIEQSKEFMRKGPTAGKLQGRFDQKIFSLSQTKLSALLHHPVSFSHRELSEPVFFLMLLQTTLSLLRFQAQVEERAVAGD